MTGSLAKLIEYAVATIPGEMSKGFIYSAYGQVGETALVYLSGVGFIRYLYRIIHPGKLKVTTRLVYNVVCLPMIIYYKGVGGVFVLFTTYFLYTIVDLVFLCPVISAASWTEVYFNKLKPW